MSLHPDLQAYVEDGEPFKMLRHPLVFSVPYVAHEQIDEMLNKSYEVKQIQIKLAREQGRWSSVVFLHERPYRINALESIKDEVPPPEFLDLLREVWVDSENIWQNLSTWRSLLIPLVGTDPWKTLTDLPDELMVYRGGTAFGLSWTLDKDKAKWFANRLKRDHPVYEGKILKKHAVGYLTERGEEEIVLDPKKIKSRVKLA